MSHRYNLAENETFKVRVFADHPCWDAHEKWWMVPMHLANSLFVAAYDCETPDHVDWIEKHHPGCVYVY